MFGRSSSDSVVHPYQEIVKPGVQFVHASILAIDPVARRVRTDSGDFEA